MPAKKYRNAQKEAAIAGEKIAVYCSGGEGRTVLGH
jgi:hypothetical protein